MMHPDPDKWYKLTTMFVEGDGLFLEGNKVSEDSFLGGAAFMSGQDPSPSGTMWKFIPYDDDTYLLTTMFVEAEELFLEGNKVDSGSYLGGAAFMSSQKPIPTGCMWKILPSDHDDYVLLTTVFVHDEGLLLEGNKVDSGSFLGGAAFMSSQRPVPSGCMWKLIEA